MIYLGEPPLARHDASELAPRKRRRLRGEHRAHHLRHGEHREAPYLAVNPQGLVPALILDDGTMLSQSLAIIEYLDETPRSTLEIYEDHTREIVAKAIAYEGF